MAQTSDKLDDFQSQLIDAERDTKDLAKMLLELGISPKLTDEEIPLCGDLLQNPKHDKENKKSVTFSGDTKPASILKNPLPPLKLHNAENINAQSSQYQELVTRLCKTESIIQSLQLSLCSMQSSKDIANKENQNIVKKLKAEIQEKTSEFKKAVQLIKKTEENQRIAEERWKSAEKEVRNLQEKLQKMNCLTTSTKEATFKELDDIRDKSARKIADIKRSLEQEKELRASLEESHNSLLTRVKDMEESVDRERNEVIKLHEECDKLKQENTKFRIQEGEYTEKAASLQSTLTNLKIELDDKERAIQKLIQEQVYNDNEQACLHNDRSKLENEIKNYGLLLDAQKSSCDKLGKEKVNLQNENESFQKEILYLKSSIEEIKQEHELELKTKNTAMQNDLKETEKRNQHVLKAESNIRKELEDRISVLEDCVQEQEKIIQEKQCDILENDKTFNSKIDELKRQLKSETREKDTNSRVKENLVTEIQKLKNTFQIEKQLLADQYQEAHLEISTEQEARRILEEENGRLLERISSIEQQEGMYKRLQDNLNSVNQTKSKLAYDKGKLQSKVEKLEQELQTMASAQSNVIQLQNTNNTLEQKFNKLSTDLANSKVELQRYHAQTNQMKIMLGRKEDEFNMAIASRYEAIVERNELERQLELQKEQENSKVLHMKQTVIDCRNDNSRLASDLETITTRQNELQETVDSLQHALGRKDNELSVMHRDKENYDIMINGLRSDNLNLKARLLEYEECDKKRTEPILTALEHAREDNLKLANSVNDLLNANEILEGKVKALQAQLDTKTSQLKSFERREESLVVEAENLTQVHTSRVEDVKKKLTEEKHLVRKQLQDKYSLIKKQYEEAQSRCSELSRGNAELRGKIAEKDKQIMKLKQLNRSLKQSGDVMQRQKELNSARSTKIEKVSTEIEKLEAAKKIYMEKNREQAETITTFNEEIGTLRHDIMALSRAQNEAGKMNANLAVKLEKEKSLNRTLENKLHEANIKYNKVKQEKNLIDERLQKAKAESVLVQKNLQEAQGWFKDKFSSLSNEINESKQSKIGAAGDGQALY